MFFFLFVYIIFYTSRAYRFLLSSLMVVQFSCLVCNRAVAKNHRAVQCDLCDSWVHIAYNNLNVYTYWKLQKDKSPWYFICCFWKVLPHGSTNDTQLKKLLHGEVFVSPNPQIISIIIKQSEYLDEEPILFFRCFFFRSVFFLS